MTLDTLTKWKDNNKMTKPKNQKTPTKKRVVSVDTKVSNKTQRPTDYREAVRLAKATRDAELPSPDSTPVPAQLDVQILDTAQESAVVHQPIPESSFELYTVRYPKNWWQAVRERFLPTLWLEQYPVKNTVLQLWKRKDSSSVFVEEAVKEWSDLNHA